MSHSTTLQCIDGKYGWPSGSSQPAADDHLFFGYTLNSDGNKRAYGSTLGFKASSSLSGEPLPTEPIVIKKITLKTSSCSTGELSIWLQDRETPAYWRSGIDTNPIGVFEDGTGTIDRKTSSYSAGALDSIREYLQDKKDTTFYLKITCPPDNQKVSGARVGGYSSSSKKNNKIIIEWDYAQTTGTVSSSNWKTNTDLKVNLTIKSKYYHKIILKALDTSENYQKIVEKNFTTTYTSYPQTNIEVTINPKLTKDKIDTFFKTNSTVTTARIVITTYSDSACTSQVGEEHIINGTLILTKDTCVNTEYINVPAIALNVSTNSLGDYYFKNLTVFTFTQTITTNGSIGSSIKQKYKLTEQRNSETPVIRKETSFATGKEINCSYKALTSGDTVTLTFETSFQDSRNFIYDKKITWAKTIKNYTAPTIEKFSAERCLKDGSKNVTGTYVKFSYSFSAFQPTAVSGNYLKTVTIKKSNSTESITLVKPEDKKKTVTNTYIYNANLATANSGTYILEVIDTLGLKSTLSFTVPKAQYILHFPEGGEALGIGTVISNSTSQKGVYFGDNWPVNGLKIKDAVNASLWGNNISSISGLANALKPTLNTMYLPLSGGKLTGDLKLAAGKSVYLTGIDSKEFRALFSGTNFYVGLDTLTGLQNHGKTFIGLGATVTDGTYTPNNNLYLRQAPTKESGTDGITYTVLHNGNYSNYLLPTFDESVAPTGSYFKSYNSTMTEAQKETDKYPPEGIYFRKNGKIVEVYGAITQKQAITGNTTERFICTIPDGFAPKFIITRVCQGTGVKKWLLRIRPALGNHDYKNCLTFSRYSDSDYSDIGSSDPVWLTFHETWIVD